MSYQSDTDEMAVQVATRDLEGLADSAEGGVEGLDRAACSPKVKYLALTGIGAAARGCSREGWREEVCHIARLYSLAELNEAEECMRHSGLWPWRV